MATPAGRALSGIGADTSMPDPPEAMAIAFTAFALASLYRRAMSGSVPAASIVTATHAAMMPTTRPVDAEEDGETAGAAGGGVTIDRSAVLTAGSAVTLSTRTLVEVKMALAAALVASLGDMMPTTSDAVTAESRIMDTTITTLPGRTLTATCLNCTPAAMARSPRISSIFEEVYTSMTEEDLNENVTTCASFGGGDSEDGEGGGGEGGGGGRGGCDGGADVAAATVTTIFCPAEQ